MNKKPVVKGVSGKPRKNNKTATDINPKASGRPSWDWVEHVEQFKKLLQMQCTDEEMAAWFEISVETFAKNKERHEFFDFYKRNKEKGKISLRRSLWQGAIGSGMKKKEREYVDEDGTLVRESIVEVAVKPCMTRQIFLSKNYLGMADASREEVVFDIDTLRNAKKMIEAKDEDMEESDSLSGKVRWDGACAMTPSVTS